MNMGVGAACGNRKTAIFTRQAVKGAVVETGEGARHFPYQLVVFPPGVPVPRPAAKTAQNKFPVFSNMTVTLSPFDINNSSPPRICIVAILHAPFIRPTPLWAGDG
jgi:hypothetical protein